MGLSLILVRFLSKICFWLSYKMVNTSHVFVASILVLLLRIIEYTMLEIMVQKAPQVIYLNTVLLSICVGP